MEPGWLGVLLKEDFSSRCKTHVSFRKTRFCFDCLVTFCHRCVDHDRHRTIYTWRNTGREIVDVEIMDEYFPCSDIDRLYCDTKTVFIKPRTQNPPKKIKGPSCVTCSRHLRGEYSYCSIACKASAISRPQNQSIGTSASPRPIVSQSSRPSKRRR